MKKNPFSFFLLTIAGFTGIVSLMTWGFPEAGCAGEKQAVFSSPGQNESCGTDSMQGALIYDNIRRVNERNILLAKDGPAGNEQTGSEDPGPEIYEVPIIFHDTVRGETQNHKTLCRYDGVSGNGYYDQWADSTSEECNARVALAFDVLNAQFASSYFRFVPAPHPGTAYEGYADSDAEKDVVGLCSADSKACEADEDCGDDSSCVLGSVPGLVTHMDNNLHIGLGYSSISSENFSNIKERYNIPNVINLYLHRCLYTSSGCSTTYGVATYPWNVYTTDGGNVANASIMLEPNIVE